MVCLLHYEGSERQVSNMCLLSIKMLTYLAVAAEELTTRAGLRQVSSSRIIRWANENSSIDKHEVLFMCAEGAEQKQTNKQSRR